MKKFYTVLCGVLVLLGLASCSSPPPTEEDIPGIYVGHYFGGVETFELRKDHRFSQKFERNRVVAYSQQGKWEFIAPSHIHLMPFLSPADVTGHDALTHTGKPVTNDVETGVLGRDPQRIDFGGWPYLAVKTLGEKQDK